MPRFRGTPRYEKLRRLGAGGMGVVYEVYDREREMPVALKTLRRLDPSSLYRFKREFRALSDLAHPNLVTLHELVSDDDQWFFTMELVDGVDLLRHVRSMPACQHRPGQLGRLFDTARLVSTLIQLVRALAALHRAERVHRDIKPTNVMVTRAGRVVLLDFGIVTDISGDSRQSTDAQLLGTTAYMAPEQVEGRKATPAADLYSVGVVLYEALTGRAPFEGPTYRALMTKLMKDPTPPSALKLPGAVDPELELLCLDLLQRDPERRPDHDELLARLGAPPDSTSERLRAPEPSSGRSSFVGRAQEIAALQGALADVRGGDARTVLVGGRSGIGKTRLVRHVLDEWHRGGGDERPTPLTLSGRCYVREMVPYKAFDGIVDELSHALMLRSRVELAELLPDDIPTLARLFPVLQRVPGVADHPRTAAPARDPVELRSRGFGALHELLLRLARRQPLVLFIDDLHWADEDSVELLADLSRPPGLPGALLLLGYRAEEVDHNPLLGDLLTRFGTGAGVQRLEIGPLSEDETGALARRLVKRSGLAPDAIDADDAALAAPRLHGETGGSPLFIAEICRYAMVRASDRTRGGTAGASLDDTGPTAKEEGAGRPDSWTDVSLDRVLLARVERLSTAVRDVVELLAVAGEPLPQSVLAAALDQPPREVERAVSRLRLESLARLAGHSDDERIDVHHDRVRETVLGSLTDAERRRRHRQLAAALERWDRAPPEALARHWDGAGEAARAGDYAEAAARVARGSLAFERAAELYRMALRFVDPDGERAQRLHETIGDCLVLAGRGGDAAEAYQRAAAGPDREAARRLRRLAAEQLLRSGRMVAGMEAAAEVLAEHDVAMPSSRLGSIATVLRFRAHAALRGYRWTERERGSIRPRTLERMDALWSVSTGLAMADPLLASAIGTRMLALSLKVGQPNKIGLALISESMMRASLRGRHDRTTAMLARRASELAHRLDDPYLRAFVELQKGVTALNTGHWVQAMVHLQPAEELFLDRCQGTSWELALLREYVLFSLVEQGKLDEIAERMPRYIRDAEVRHDLFALAIMRCRFHLLWLARDDLARAEAQLEGALDSWPRGMVTMQHYHVMLSRIEQRLYTGDADGARAVLDAGLGDLRGSANMAVGLLRLDIAFLRARVALALAAAGHDPAGNRHEALRRMARAPTHFPHSGACRALVEACVAHGAGRDEEALARLADAEAGFGAADMALHASVMARVRGRLAGGDEGQARAADAEARLRAVGVVEPDRMARVFTPGLI